MHGLPGGLHAQQPAQLLGTIRRGLGDARSLERGTLARLRPISGTQIGPFPLALIQPLADLADAVVCSQGDGRGPGFHMP
jgi:hypothetical protein